MSKLSIILPELERDIKNFKIHFASTNKPTNRPLDAFFRGDFKSWQEWQNNENFKRKFILSLIEYGKNTWLFAGIYKSISSEWANDHFHYETELLPIGETLIGRLVVHYNKKFRQSYPNLETCFDELLISEITKEKIAVQKFPGYEKIKIEFEQLKTIITKSDVSWETALRNIKGVYLITDKLNGKQYVGSAYGGNAFWDRWGQYCGTGHGGNVDLKKVIKDNGIGYASNFQFSILEIRASSTSDDEIINRESHWKDILLTREFGYNLN